MKEKKYKDIKNFENKNTFHVFDQFETQRLQGAKNRFIYDFSWPIIDDLTTEESLTKAEGKWKYNKSPWARGEDYAPIVSIYGDPGEQVRIIAYNDTTNQSIEYANAYANTINTNESTFYYNERCIGFINEKRPNVYGARGAAEYVNYFRSGYVEFTFKTDKQNCIIVSGSQEITVNEQAGVLGVYGNNFANGTSVSSLFKGDTANLIEPIQEKLPYYLSSSFDGALVNLNIEIKDGKMLVNYYDKYNRDDISFNFAGNKNVADNNWHHVVINFGRPGLIKEHGKKFNKKFVEIWVDGQLDKRFDDKVNEHQIFYPTIEWFFNSPIEFVTNVTDDFIIENQYDNGLPNNASTFFGNTDFDALFSSSNIYRVGITHPKNIIKAFKGSLQLFAHGINIPLSQYEIKKRFRLWQKETKKLATICDVTAEMKMPTISTNSKKALKLYWNELIYSGKDGLSLDDNFQVESYSVISKCNNSKTEIYNVDKSILKNIEILENVRVAFTDNIIIYGPGMIWYPNLSEAFQNTLSTQYKSKSQHHPKQNSVMDSVGLDNGNGVQPQKSWEGPRIDLPMSGLQLNNGDRILLTGQIKTEDNGIWIFNGLDGLMTRSADALLNDPVKNYIVYIEEGYNKNTYWQLNNTIESFIDPQKWTLIDVLNLDELASIPLHTTRWKDYLGEDRLINLEEDININNYDVVVFMNYPETNEELFQHFPNDPEALVIKQYKNFIQSIKNVAANGASIYVSSPRLATDLGIVKGFTEVPQLLQTSDAAAASLSPFELGEPAERYFDTHRNNKYKVATTLTGLTNKETYLLTDFINFTPESEYDFDQYHAKYSYRQFGLQEGNEFIIPGTALRKVTEKDDLPGYKQNQIGTKPLMAVEPQNILAGTVITQLANTYYNNSTVTNNPYDDYATTIVVHNGQLLGGTPITGKIFVNCIEDGYTFSREEYNKAVIQTLPQTDVNETTATRAWQYSTTRLDRKPQRLNVSGLSSYGQTVPTNGGGGAFIQAPSNSSYGVIRYETDKDNLDYQSDIYPTTEEEIYPLQEIPVLSMTYLGLQWLAG
jgi:hypothetical protein